MRDGDPDPYPAGAALAEIQAHIDALRPVGMIGVEVFAPQPVPVDLELRVEPDTAQIRELVTSAIADLLFREGGPSLGQEETFLPLSRISEAISSAAGERSHEIVSPTTAPRVTRRELLTLGDITWS